MPSIRWIDRTQPQTLMMATIIMYINAVFGILFGQVGDFPIGTLLVVGQVAAGLGIANEKKWGYWLGVGLIAPFLAYLILYIGLFQILTILFYGALLALLLHPQSREYRRVWFRW